MKLLDLIHKESQISFRGLLATAAVAGISNAGILAVINAAAAHASGNNHDVWHMALFAVIMALYVLAQKHTMLTTTSEIEQVLDRIRVRIADKVRRCDLHTLERIGRSDIYACVSKETLTVSQSATVLVVGAQSAILIFFTVLYIAWLSMTAFLLSVSFTLMAVSIHFKQRRKLNQDLHEAMARENQFFDALTDMLDGFKETKMNRARSEDLYDYTRGISASATELKIRTQSLLSTNFIFSQTSFYLLLATVVFIVPNFSHAYSDVVIKTATAVLFLIGPISNLVGAIPVLAMANAAAENIATMEETLDRGMDRTLSADPPLTGFRNIELRGVCFSYGGPGDGSEFRVGPLDLTVQAGEMLFVAGGNGSGKSTFMKLLTGLYPPSAGVIRVDGRELNGADTDAYRQLFAVIFSDYHMFKRLYGLHNVDPARVQGLLDEMELTGKTRLEGDQFQTLDLSTGQKKRLALVVAILEDRPVLVLDEWAADQDPVFRKKFYTELLPRFKQQGKTVIAVTHDDKYYGVADRVARMEEGRIKVIAAGGDHGL